LDIYDNCLKNFEETAYPWINILSSYSNPSKKCSFYCASKSNDSSNICEKCESGYELNNGICISKCTEGFTVGIKKINVGKIVTCTKDIITEHCITYDNDGKCEEYDDETTSTVITSAVTVSEAGSTDVPTKSDNEFDDETTTVVTSTVTVSEVGFTDVPTEADNESDDEQTATEAGSIDIPTEADNESDDEQTATKAGEVRTEGDNGSDDEDTKYRCGPKYGKCKEWECCSKYNWCGVTEKHCSIEAGCQSEFGKCNQRKTKKVKTVIKTTTKAKTHPWKCGGGIGSCKKGYCCSKYGWCGKSEAYCSKEKGCQSEFGRCW